MYEGDMSRKRMLVEHGFRLPSAMDNRPLKFEEFVDRIGQTVYLSATPGPYELGRTKGEFVEQVIRPTGLVDPEIVVKPTKGQIDDLVGEIRERADRNERVLVTTLTKKMAEDLTDYLLELGIRVRYLHSEVDTLRRIELLRELRLGEFDVLVGINLLREGLDLPEVSLVSILDADKEGFLRSGTSLIQTIGRAARNVSGQVHMYADTITPSMKQRDRRDEPAPREAGRVQPRARHRPAAAAQADRRHHRPARPRGRRHRRAARRDADRRVGALAVARQVGGAGPRRARRLGRRAVIGRMPRRGTCRGRAATSCRPVPRAAVEVPRSARSRAEARGAGMAQRARDDQMTDAADPPARPNAACSASSVRAGPRLPRVLDRSCRRPARHQGRCPDGVPAGRCRTGDREAAPGRVGVGTAGPAADRLGRGSHARARRAARGRGVRRVLDRPATQTARVPSAPCEGPPFTACCGGGGRAEVGS